MWHVLVSRHSLLHIMTNTMSAFCCSDSAPPTRRATRRAHSQTQLGKQIEDLIYDAVMRRQNGQQRAITNSMIRLEAKRVIESNLHLITDRTRNTRLLYADRCWLSNWKYRYGVVSSTRTVSPNSPCRTQDCALAVEGNTSGGDDDDGGGGGDGDDDQCGGTNHEEEEEDEVAVAATAAFDVDTTSTTIGSEDSNTSVEHDQDSQESIDTMARIEWADRCIRAIAKQPTLSIPQFMRDTKCPLSYSSLKMYVRIRRTATNQPWSRPPSYIAPALGKHFEDQLYQAVMRRHKTLGDPVTSAMIIEEATSLAHASDGSNAPERIHVCSTNSWLNNWKRRYHVVCSSAKVDASIEPPATTTDTTTTTSTTTTTCGTTSVAGANSSTPASTDARVVWAHRCLAAITADPQLSLQRFVQSTKCPIAHATLRNYVRRLRDTGSLTFYKPVNTSKPALGREFEDQVHRAVMEQHLTHGIAIDNAMIVQQAIQLASLDETTKSQRLEICTGKYWVTNWKMRYKIVCPGRPRLNKKASLTRAAASSQLQPEQQSDQMLQQQSDPLLQPEQQSDQMLQQQSDPLQQQQPDPLQQQQSDPLPQQQPDPLQQQQSDPLLQQQPDPMQQQQSDPLQQQQSDPLPQQQQPDPLPSFCSVSDTERDALDTPCTKPDVAFSNTNADDTESESDDGLDVDSDDAFNWPSDTE
jgi:hypothetical protein